MKPPMNGSLHQWKRLQLPTHDQCLNRSMFRNLLPYPPDVYKRQTDYGPNNDGVTDYNDTDYGPNNDGVTDYNDTNYDDHGNTNYGDTNYDDGGSDYDREADDDWDDGDSGYDD